MSNEYQELPPAVPSSEKVDVVPFFVVPSLSLDDRVTNAHEAGLYNETFVLWQRNHLRNLTEPLTCYGSEGLQARLYILDYCLRTYIDGTLFYVACGIVMEYIDMFTEYMERDDS